MVRRKAEINPADLDSARTAEAIERNRDVLVGIKTAPFGLPGWTAIDRAVAAGRLAHVPVMVDDKILTTAGRSTRDKVLEHLRPGDIHTHMFNDRQVELLDRFPGKIPPDIVEARRRGVLPVHHAPEPQVPPADPDWLIVERGPRQTQHGTRLRDAQCRRPRVDRGASVSDRPGRVCSSTSPAPS